MMANKRNVEAIEFGVVRCAIPVSVVVFTI